MRLALGIIIILMIGGIIFLGVQTSHNNTVNSNNIATNSKNIADNSKNITTNSNNIAALQSQLDSANTQINTLKDQLKTANSDITTLKNQTNTQIATLQSNIANANSQITAFTSQVSTIATRIQSLQTSTSTYGTDLTALQSQVTSANSQLTSLQSSLATLQSTVTSLQSTVSSLSTGTSSSNTSVAIFSGYAISQSFGAFTTLATYTPNYSGHFTISGTSSSATGYIRVTNNDLGTYIDYSFGTGTTVTVPGTAGNSYLIRFGNTDSSGTITATLNATYYNSGSNTSTSSNSVELISGYAISQSHGAFTTIVTYTTTASGYFTISGTSSSATGYIRVTNNDLGTNDDYSFGTGTTVTVPGIAGNSYVIRFGNTDSTGTVTATLSATYNNSGSIPSTTGNSIVLLSNNPISLSPGDISVLIAYVPTYSGYFSISGTSSSSKAYVRIVNNELGTYNDYPFSTGITVTSSGTAAKSYSIRLGNSDTSATITGTVNVKYYY